MFQTGAYVLRCSGPYRTVSWESFVPVVAVVAVMPVVSMVKAAPSVQWAIQNTDHGRPGSLLWRDMAGALAARQMRGGGPKTTSTGWPEDGSPGPAATA
ncbi:hypothetical protein [Streptomyces sp. NBC_00690]|uniref:hypothetical protein n=1 Tax=Streptomyces sp. NBC_00690 TaxID=2975808 RepID=UPI002E27B797|nr:hypothetical protein [Streptomyces sp. NBC_00690]